MNASPPASDVSADARRSSRVRLAGFAAATAAAGAAGAIASRRGIRVWYRFLRKPPFQPPPQAFAPVWTALYALMAYSAWRVSEAPDSNARRRALGLWWTQLALNAAWSPLFFGLRRPRLALADLALLLAAIGGYTAAARRVDRTAAAAMTPYLAWTLFAGVLNEEIVRRNR
jgi:tryptophan-rich sensory protein